MLALFIGFHLHFAYVIIIGIVLFAIGFYCGNKKDN